jgi:hypothetical protein
MSLGDLTSLANVKAWLSPPLTSGTDDALLTRLISAASRFIMGYLDRPTLLSQPYAETRDGLGGRMLLLRQWPVTSVTSLTVDGNLIPPVSLTGSAAGWLLDGWDGWTAGQPQALSLLGYAFPRGLQNVAIGYTAGYAVTGEEQAVPAAAPYTLTTMRSWAADLGVAYVGGAALVPVDGSPLPGQYNVAAGLYTFNALDTGKAVAISYSYLPLEVEQACIELVSLRYQERQRIGQVSKSLAGEVVAFTQKDMQDDVVAGLAPYRRVFAP